ncbi:IS3 family transposase [Spirosoma sp. HMF4905]|uniref:IS3 family transposase n=1 Tax=Spirosoma arboris TaxID=2682092 RepID=A0A7K1SHA5_9BACT|nr:IS3 family transposase [Spirosoma arboris]
MKKLNTSNWSSGLLLNINDDRAPGWRTSRRITAELQEKGHSVGRYQVRTLMKMVGLQAIQPLRRPG